MKATPATKLSWRQPWAWGIVLVACLAFLWPQVVRQTTTQPQHIFDLDQDIPKFNSSGQSKSCIDLARALPDQVFSQEHPFFEHSRLKSFSAQARDEAPTCIVRPQNVEQVSRAIKLLRAEYDAKRDARFAIRSGGHYTGPNHSTIHGGVLLDMSAFDEITVSPDRTSVVLGVGSRWGRVYRELDEQNLRVAGGRDAGVGVGGLSLGGGISHLSPRVGMVCDNILEYEIVLASGDIERISASHRPDLWRALKGGSSNFGVVTRITARAFPGGKIWGGYRYWLLSSGEGLYDAFHDFVSNQLDEDAASPLLSIGYASASGNSGYAGFFAYNSLKFEGRWPPAYRGFQKFWGVWGGVKKRTVGDIAVELHGQSKEDRRNLYATLTCKNDREVFRMIPKLFEKYKPRMKEVKSATFSLIVQPLPATITHKGDPNVLGLESRNVTDPTPIVILAATDYIRPEDDGAVEDITRMILKELDTFARERGSGDEFLYLNYAADWQDPISSYGLANKKFLQDVSRKYDPRGFFQKALAGGFKLGMYA